MKYISESLIRPLLLIGILSIFQFSFSSSATAQQISELEKTVLATHRESVMRHGMIAVSVYNITQGKLVYEYNSQLALAPGSVNKLLTTGVAFARLGSNFRFSTRLGIRGTVDRDGVLHGDVYIIGGGDPMLGSYRYRQTSIDSLFEGWMLALRKKESTVLTDVSATIRLFSTRNPSMTVGLGAMWAMPTARESMDSTSTRTCISPISTPVPRLAIVPPPYAPFPKTST